MTKHELEQEIERLEELVDRWTEANCELERQNLKLIEALQATVSDWAIIRDLDNATRAAAETLRLPDVAATIRRDWRTLEAAREARLARATK